MKKLMMPITVFIVALGFTAMILAEASAKSKSSNQVSGEVTAVDAQAKSVTVQKNHDNGNEGVTLTLTDKTKIMKGKEKKTLADIQSGARVTATFEEDTMTAKSIRIMEAKKK